MQNKIQIPLFLFIVITWGSCNIENNKKQTTYDQIKNLADAYVEGSLRFYPEKYSYFGFKNASNSKLSDNSLSGIENWRNFIDSLYLRFKTIDSIHKVNSKEWHLYGYLKEAIERDIKIRSCKTEFLSINHLRGWQVVFQDIAAHQPVGNDKNREDAKKRWNKLPLFVDNEIENLEEGLRQGYSVPKRIVELVIEQIEELYNTPLVESGFYSPIERDTCQIFKKDWQQILKNDVYPTLLKYKNFLKKEYLPQARKTIACSKLPGKVKNYEAYHRYFISIERNHNEILDISEYRLRLNQSKLKMYGADKYKTENIPKILDNIYKDSLYYFKNEEKIVEFINGRLATVRAACDKVFYTTPDSKLKVEAIPVHLEDHQGSYYMPSLNDLNMSSVYAVNLKQSRKKMKVEVETEIFHETFPGHHFQLNYNSKIDSVHDIVKFVLVNGFVEGWASYAQILADEMDLYSSNFSQYAVLGRSSMIAYLDAKLHLGKLSEQEAIEHLMKNGIQTEKKAESILNRMAVWPGQFLTYEFGLLEFLELREKAKLSLGDQFNIKEFHQIVLEGGSMPLPMLREKIDWWIQLKLS